MGKETRIAGDTMPNERRSRRAVLVTARVRLARDRDHWEHGISFDEKLGFRI
ncbi:hypothetical protein HC891_09895 [Candidatus Gracilibacteria bacterium]|nr:hypothetical protein [Candidatus Gracilibacteria bacterium]